jgi:hypothetical protein
VVGVGAQQLVQPRSTGATGLCVLLRARRSLLLKGATAGWAATLAGHSCPMGRCRAPWGWRRPVARGLWRRTATCWASQADVLAPAVSIYDTVDTGGIERIGRTRTSILRRPIGVRRPPGPVGAQLERLRSGNRPLVRGLLVRIERRPQKTQRGSARKAHVHKPTHTQKATGYAP